MNEVHSNQSFSTPGSTTPLTLTLGQLKPYEHNPRREPHPCYALLKHSIRVRGLEQPLVVTRRPGEAEYLVKAGGNTRLQILQELYRETGEERFCQVLCTFIPWMS
jgi:ParB family protein of integrating conjugative element (PFGI_1 class)